VSEASRHDQLNEFSGSQIDVNKVKHRLLGHSNYPVVLWFEVHVPEKVLSILFLHLCFQVWLRQIQSLLARDMGDAAHKALDQSLLSLPRRKHIKVISRAALLEFKTGSVERARSIFEGILRNYPKRVDLWSVYLDQVFYSQTLIFWYMAGHVGSLSYLTSILSLSVLLIPLS
jgi:hypothetical protein